MPLCTVSAGSTGEIVSTISGSTGVGCYVAAGMCVTETRWLQRDAMVRNA